MTSGEILDLTAVVSISGNTHRTLDVPAQKYKGPHKDVLGGEV